MIQFINLIKLINYNHFMKNTILKNLTVIYLIFTY